jgi:hypothetical protein
MAEIIRITSEALQSTIRRLLPSQQGFGDDLMASSVITPIIDLTPTAEGSAVRQDLQTALSLDSVTAWARPLNAVGSTTIINNAGFWRVVGAIYANSNTPAACNLSLTDGISSKKIYEITGAAFTGTFQVNIPLDFVVYLNSGESLTANTTIIHAGGHGSVQQIADSNGDFVNPAGFNPQ